MRITNIFLGIVILSLSICSSCSSPSSSNPPPESLTNLDSSTEPQQTSSTIPQAAIDYALIQAKFFRDPVDDINALYDHPNFFSFLITRVYSQYQNGNISLKDVSKNDWYKQYLIPAEYMEKASSLYLGIDNPLPDIFYFPHIPHLCL